MSWNYRVVKTKQGYSVFEVFYDENGLPNGITEKPTLSFYCDSIEDLETEIELFKEACSSPAIEEQYIGQNSGGT